MNKVKKYIKYLILFIILIFISYSRNNIKKAYSSLVYIESFNEISTMSGTGFVYKVESNMNYIVTNYHIVEGYYNIYVYNRERSKEKAIVINYDEANDIAILLIEDNLGLKPISFADSDKINIGDKVFALGYPLGISNLSLDGGSITGFIDVGYDFKTIEVSIKTDFGSSGSPLLNSEGKVIGMVFLKDSNNNLSYSIPINFILNDILKLESRPSLGTVMTNSTNKELIEKYGLNESIESGIVILELNENSLLSEYGLKAGDVILYINDNRVLNVQELREELYNYNIGDTIKLTYYRDIYYDVNIKLR